MKEDTMNKRFKFDLNGADMTDTIRAILVVAAVFAATVIPLIPML